MKSEIMKFAEITIQIHVAETKLTPEQQAIATKSDTDLSVDHPLTRGYDDLVAMLDNVAASYFNYLKVDAVTVEVE